MTRLAPLILAVALLAAGCAAPQRSTVTGGSTSDTQAGVSVVVVLPNGTRIEHSDTSTRHATTQPSIETTGMNAKVAGGDGIGGVVLSAIPAVNKGNLWLGFAMLVAAAFVGLVLKDYLWCGLLGSIGVLSFVAPTWLAGVALVVCIGIVAFLARKHIRQLVKGADTALAEEDPAKAKALREKMEREHDATTKRAVRAARGK